MTQYDVFNGDADGICALHQLRLAQPADHAELITGVKRDIALLDRVQATAGDQITVLDVSLDKNREALERLLANQVRVFYVDHHHAGDIPDSPLLEAMIDTASDVCTSLLVNRRLNGAHLAWAVTAAFGDNLHDAARRAAEPLDLSTKQLDALEKLGTYINYNGYGPSLKDLYYHPAELYRRIRPYADPLQFIAEDDAYSVLRDGYGQDMDRAAVLQPDFDDGRAAMFVLPDASWARRVSGVYANDLAVHHPERAHALLTTKPEGGYLVSVRAPHITKDGADALCRQFATGGGRKGAAGINHLPEADLEKFEDAFRAAFGRN